MAWPLHVYHFVHSNSQSRNEYAVKYALRGGMEFYVFKPLVNGNANLVNLLNCRGDGVCSQLNCRPWHLYRFMV